MSPGIFSQLGGEEVPQVPAGEAGGPEARGRGRPRAGSWTRGSGKRMPGTSGAGGADDRAGLSIAQGGGSGGGVVADALGVQEVAGWPALVESVSRRARPALTSRDVASDDVARWTWQSFPGHGHSTSDRGITDAAAEPASGRR